MILFREAASPQRRYIKYTKPRFIGGLGFVGVWRGEKAVSAVAQEFENTEITQRLQLLTDFRPDISIVRVQRGSITFVRIDLDPK